MAYAIGGFSGGGKVAAITAMMKVARERLRHVLLTGDQDYYLRSTRQTYEQGYRHDRFRHVAMIVVPGLAHALPPAAWFERGIVFLERERNRCPETMPAEQ